jgi:thiol-disulfide isomerase/thioredoxin
MKPFILIFNLMLLVPFLHAQTPKSLEDPAMDVYYSKKENVPILKGRLKNVTKADADTLRIQYSLVQLEQESQVELSTALNPDGSFEIKLTQALPYQQLWLRLPFTFMEIVLCQGLNIEGDLKHLREISQQKKKQNDYARFPDYELVFSGPDAEINYLKNKFNDFEPDNKEQIDLDREGFRDFSQDLPTRLNALKEANEKLESLEKQFLALNPSKYGWMLSNERLSEYYGNMFVCFWGKEIPEDETFEAAWRHQPALVSNDGTAYYRYLSMLYGLTHSKNPLEKIKEMGFSSRKKDIVTMMGGGPQLEDRKSYLDNALPQVSSLWVKQKMQNDHAEATKQVQEINQRLQNISIKNQSGGPGVLYAEFDNGAKLYLNSGKNVDSLIQKVRAMHPGQAIIFDLWTTWCGPCIHDMKNSKEQKEALKKIGVTVVYLGINDSSSQEQWSKKIAELGVTGDHIWLDEPIATGIMQQFQLTGYPSYLFFDKAGNYHPNVVPRIQHVDLDAIKKLL